MGKKDKSESKDHFQVEREALAHLIVLFTEAGHIEMAQALAADLGSGKITTIDEIQKEVVEWAKNNAANAVYLVRLLMRGRYDGQEHFAQAGVSPTTIGDKWLYGIKKGTSPCHPVVAIMVQFLLAGADQALNPDQSTRAVSAESLNKTPYHGAHH